MKDKQNQKESCWHSFSVQRFVIHFINRLKERKKAVIRYKKWRAHEAEWKRKGDTRCDFERLVFKCRMLRLDVMIYNPGRCENPNHKQGCRPQQYV